MLIAFVCLFISPSSIQLQLVDRSCGDSSSPVSLGSQAESIENHRAWAAYGSVDPSHSTALQRSVIRCPHQTGSDLW